MATMQHKIFCVREFIKNESANAVKRAIESIFLNHPVELLLTLRCVILSAS
jgi:hypothetical protein